ncbi:hypothetical protein F5880DRAFT_1512329, partial [Lentinula raphanica]
SELSVLVVRFCELERILLNVCACRTAAVQLVERGLFPCAPLQPSLAVDMRVLDFVARLFLRISPNTTALADTICDFLSSQGYHMQGEDPLRRRFGNALHWYTSLQDAMTQFIDSILSVTRSLLLEDDEPSMNFLDDVDEEVAMCEEFDEDNNGADDDNDDDENENKNDDDDDDDDDKSDDDNTDDTNGYTGDTPTLARPSEYLRARCPLCFGGHSTLSDGMNVIKHNKQRQRDPPCQHPRTVFVPESDVKLWEDLVGNVRPSKEKGHRGKQTPIEKVDTCEGPLKVPNSVLDECEQSFTAADETREKASAQFFDSTALMGLLCRHDRVLWLVNMTSPGEWQHYALSLIDLLFRHLPQDWTVGVLYDIGCQIHRSCVRWGFLDQYLHRITFAISVFHAYGHGWACQCVYHPRKCHHLRLYTLDLQVNHSASESLTRMGKWLSRKWHNAKVKHREADVEVKASGRAHFGFSGQSKEAGRKAIENALRLKKACDTLVERIAKAEEILSDAHAEAYEIAEGETQLPALREKLSETRSALVREERKLGGSPFINLRMNARAIKTRLRSRLAARKFERDRVERTFRRQQYNDRKVHHHTEDSVKKRDPSIQKLARQYNSLCAEMQKLITLNRAPHNACSPALISMKELFNLDVDDEIWQDVGLDDSDGQDPPLWLSDDKVRSGIKAILMRDRCNEELLRLKHEEEWNVVSESIGATTDLDILYQLNKQKDNLVRLYIIWEKELKKIPCFVPVKGWGPTEVELNAMQELIETEQVVVDDDEEASFDSDESTEFDEDDLDAGLIECMDTLQLVDAAASRLEEDLDDPLL